MKRVNKLCHAVPRNVLIIGPSKGSDLRSKLRLNLYAPTWSRSEVICASKVELQRRYSIV